MEAPEPPEPSRAPANMEATNGVAPPGSSPVQAEPMLARVLSRMSSQSAGGAGAGSSERGATGSGSLDEPTPEEQEAMKAARDRGNKLFEKQLFAEAAAAYTEALRHARTAVDVGTLLSNRSAAYASLSRGYRSRPARRSECAALFDLDPTSLAQMAHKDATKAVDLRPDWGKAYSRKGTALFLLERYHEAREAYLEGLALHPTNASLQEGMREVQAILMDPQDASPRADAAGATPFAAGAAAGAAAEVAGAEGQGAGSSGRGLGRGSAPLATKRQRSMGAGAARDVLDDWDCILCAELLFEPVTTPCGHTFCKECFARAVDHNPRCPCCRTVLHVARDQLPVSITLANIISHAFPDEYEQRRAKAAGAAVDGGTAARAGGGDGAAAEAISIPLFVMSLLMPGESIALNIFEPRYRLMVRRCMEGSRRFGMAQARRDQREIDDVAVEAEIVDCQAQPDGRYYLEIVGRRRLLIRSHGELDGYRVARCEVLQDNAPQPGTPEHATLPQLVAQVQTQVEGVVTQLRPLASGGSRLALRVRSILDGLGDRPPAAQHEKFSLWAATVVCTLCPELDKAELLRSTDTAQRLRTLRDKLGQRMAGGGPQGCALM